MSATQTSHDGGDEASLGRLAEKLVRRLGVEEALRVCRENSWHGVLRIIQNRQNDGMYI